MGLIILQIIVGIGGCTQDLCQAPLEGNGSSHFILQAPLISAHVQQNLEVDKAAEECNRWKKKILKYQQVKNKKRVLKTKHFEHFRWK